MKTLKTVPGQNLVLGHRGENLATRIIFSIAPWVETYGPGTAHLLHQRQGDSEPYPVATLQEGTEVSWDVTDGDTALEGYGKYELRYYVAETLVKSSVGETYTMKALQYGAEPPDPIQGWVDHVLEKENEIYEAASETKGYSEAAERAAGDALNFANAADQSAGNARLSAKTAADQAGQAAGSAKEAKEAAEEARKIVDGADVVKSVNGQAPDKNGNVRIEVGSGSGVDVTAKPGQLIRVKSVDENGKPTAWEAVPWGYTEGGTVHPIPGKLLPEGVPYVEQGGTAELPIVGGWADEGNDTDGDGNIDEHEYMFVTTAPIGLEVGKTYIVNWDGTEYECTGLDMNEISGGEMPGVFIGNLANFGGEDNGLPFMLIEMSAEIGAAEGIYAVAMALDNTQVDFSIYHTAEIVHKLDNRCLDLDWIPTKKAKETEILPEMFTSEYDNELKPTALPIGTVVAVYWDGVRHECTVSTVEGSEGALYFGYLGGYPFAFFAMYESLPYTIQTADGEEHTVSVSLVEYEYNVIPSGYLGESTSAPISLIDLGMPVATGSETIFATDTSEVMKKLKNGSKVKAVFKARFETENGHTDGTVTAIFDGTRYFNGASTVKDTFIFSKMICMYACLYAVTLRVEDGQYVAGVHKLLDNSATEV